MQPIDDFEPVDAFFGFFNDSAEFCDELCTRATIASAAIVRTDGRRTFCQLICDDSSSSRIRKFVDQLQHVDRKQHGSLFECFTLFAHVASVGSGDSMSKSMTK